MILRGYSYSLDSNMNHKELKISDFDFLKSLDTRWRDMDAIQHINNATILSYFETVRVAFLNDLGFSLVRRQNKGVILASMKIDYFSQLSHPSAMKIGCRIVRIGTTSFDLCSAIFFNGFEKPISAGTFTLVTFNYTKQKSIPITESIKDSFQPFKP